MQRCHVVPETFANVVPRLRIINVYSEP
jgi:hypothetical protein